MSSVNEANLEKKFQAVSNTQDSIQSMSLWILHHKAHCTKIVGAWMKVLKKAKIGHRLTLFYLANDVIQNGKRKGAAQFGAAFGEVLREAILLLKDDKIKGSIERVLRIWEHRSVFPAETISDLLDILSSAKICKDTSAKILAEFKPENVTSYIQKMQKVEVDSASKLAALNSSKLDAATSEVLSQLKDRTHGQKFSKEFDDATRCLEDYIKTLEKEVKVRQEVIQVLEQAEIYYDTQRGEARVVANAYKNFAGRVKIQKKKLEELVSRLPSPVPSPCADAPSPSNSEGLDLSPILEAPDASPPSPIGTPDGLMSPLTAPTDKDPSLAGALNSFLPQAPGMMTSWLDSFSSAVTPTSEAGSLDSRLLNFMQKLPNIPSKSAVQSAKGASANAEPKAVVAIEDSMGLTPVKDEHSGQATPVQDEDTQTNPQQMLSKLISIAKVGKDLPEDLLSKFSPSMSYSGAGGNKGFLDKEDGIVFGSESTDRNVFDSLTDKDWRIPPKASGTGHSQKLSSPFQSPDAKRFHATDDDSSPSVTSAEKNKSFDASYHHSDSTFSNNISIVDRPPWNTAGSYQMSEGNRTLDEKVKHFQEPLQPPPKPSFSGFNDIFGSPSFSTSIARDDEPQLANIKSASSTQAGPQSRQDPRLNSQNYPKGTSNESRGEHGKQECDDTEPMDMDLGDSDNEDSNAGANHEKNSRTSHSLDTANSQEIASTEVESMPEDSPQEHVGTQPSRPNDDFSFDEDRPDEDVGGPQPSRSNDHFSFAQDRPHEDIGRPQSSRPDDHFHFGQEENSGPQSSRHGDHFPFAQDGPPEDISSTVARSKEHIDYLIDQANDDQGHPARTNDQFPYSQEGSRGKFNTMNPANHDRMMPPNHDRMMPPDHDRMMPPDHDRMLPPDHNRIPPDRSPMKQFNRDRDIMFRGPMPMRSYPMDEDDHWRTGNWNAPRGPPWHGPRPRYEDNGHLFDEFGYNGRGGPGFDVYGPPPMKRFPPPPPYFGRERRGFFLPRHH